MFWFIRWMDGDMNGRMTNDEFVTGMKADNWLGRH